MMVEVASTPSAKEYTQKISRCGTQWLHALQLLRSAARSRTTRLDVAVYNAAMKCCDRSQQWPTALHLFEELQERFQPSIISYSTAASACATGAAWRAALAVARSAARLSAAADVAAVNAAITACQRAQRWERSLDLFAATPRPTAITYGAALAAAGTAGASSASGAWRAAMAAELLEGCRRREVELNVVMVNAAIGVCEPIWEQALHLFRSLLPRGLRPSAVSVSSAVRALPPLRWRSALGALGAEEANVAAVNCAASTVGSAQRWVQALELWTCLAAAALRPNAATPVAVLKALEEKAVRGRGLRGRGTEETGWWAVVRWNGMGVKLLEYVFLKLESR
ncbi:unnamed protein product [Durusdinium trenchii]|uniref:Pentatricopeptide repeat-containing protein n=1 Tax=Durusdinium trenchii TaxID=1381693 RepID=A0ABP0M466_9DINO